MLECVFEVEDLQKSPEDNLNNIKTILNQVFEAANSPEAALALPTDDFIKRKVSRILGRTFSSPLPDPANSQYRFFEKVFYGNKTKLCIP